MARLPGMTHLIQQIGGQVILFENYTEKEIVRFDPGDGIAVADALDVIRDSELGDEDKCYACFWSGYFHAYSDRNPEMAREVFVTETTDGRVQVLQNGWTEIVKFDPRDGNASALAQKPIYDSGLSQDEKNRAHFWCGFFYALASGS
jgi:hypothetical protein